MRDAPQAERCARAHPIIFAVACGAAICSSAPRASADPSKLPPEIGYNYGKTETPRIAATGGALRAMSNSTSALFTNPANMAVTRVYHIAAFAQIWPQASRQGYGAAIVDSIVSSTRLAGGFGGSWNRQDPDGVDRTFIDLRFALAYPFSDVFYVGAAGRFLSLEQDGFPRGLGLLRDSIAAGGLDDEPIVRTITFDAGMTLKPVDELALSIVGYNLTDAGHGFLPLMLGGGIGFGTEIVTLEADALADFTTYDDTRSRAMGGGEVLIAEHFPIRAGYRYDQGAESHAVTGGIGFIEREYAVEVSLERVVSGDPVTAIVFGFSYHLESSGLSPGGGF